MDKRTHLIERAAARLEAFGSPSATAGAAARNLTVNGQAARLQPVPRESQPETAAPAKPRITAQVLTDAGLISSGAVHDRVVEEFRIVQSKVLRQGFGANGTPVGVPDNLVMITSSVDGEGKSFCAINLAAEVARQGDRRALLIDTDPKPDGLAAQLGASGEMGLLDFARGKAADVETLIISTEADGLDFLPYGTNGNGSAELFASRRMADAIMDIARRSPDRLVVFDAPPCLSSSTPHTLASIVGQVVLIVAAGRTQESDVEAALDLVQACPHVSLLLNKVPTWLAHSFGSHPYPVAKG